MEEGLAKGNDKAEEGGLPEETAGFTEELCCIIGITEIIASSDVPKHSSTALALTILQSNIMAYGR